MAESTIQVTGIGPKTPFNFPLLLFPDRNVKRVTETSNPVDTMQDKTLPHFLLKTKEEEKGGKVSPLAWYQPVLTFRFAVWVPEQ